MADHKKILVLRLGAMGDILFTTPALRGLKVKYPGCHITYVCLKKWTFLLKRNTYIDRIVGLQYREPKALGKLLNEQFDLIVNFHELEDGAQLCQAIEAKKRLGHQWINGKIQPDAVSRLLIRNTETLKKLHMARIHYPDLYCRIAGVSVNDYQYTYTPPVISRWMAGQWLRKNRLKPKEYIVLHTHSRGMPSKTWPAEHVRAVTRTMLDQTFVVIGYKPDYDITKLLSEEPNIKVSMASIETQASIIKQSRLFIGIDSGPRQIAAAVGAPSLTLFGPRPPEHLPMFSGDRNLHIKCPDYPCYMDSCPHKEQCMLRLDSQLIVETAREMLK